jgi:hypothetical protein
LDEQLVIANRTLDAYAQSVQLYELQFKYGQTSQMTVAQAQSQYETAAAQIPQIESQIAQTENGCRSCSEAIPGRIPRGKSIYDLALPAVPFGRAIFTARAAPGSPAVGADADCRECADRGRARALLSRRSRLPARSAAPARSSRTCSRARPACELHRTGRRTDLHVRRGQRPGGAGEASQRSALYNYQYSIQNAFADVDNSLVANAKLQDQLGAQSRLVAALRTTRASRSSSTTAGYTSYTTVLQAEQSLFPAGAHARVGARVGILVGGEHLQGDGRRLGHDRRPDDRPRTRMPLERAASRRSRCSERARSAPEPGCKAGRRYFGNSARRRGRARGRRESPKVRRSTRGRTPPALPRPPAHAAGIPASRRRSASTHWTATGST